MKMLYVLAILLLYFSLCNTTTAGRESYSEEDFNGEKVQITPDDIDTFITTTVTNIDECVYPLETINVDKLMDKDGNISLKGTIMFMKTVNNFPVGMSVLSHVYKDAATGTSKVVNLDVKHKSKQINIFENIDNSISEYDDFELISKSSMPKADALLSLSKT